MAVVYQPNQLIGNEWAAPARVVYSVVFGLRRLQAYTEYTEYEGNCVGFRREFLVTPRSNTTPGIW